MQPTDMSENSTNQTTPLPQEGQASACPPPPPPQGQASACPPVPPQGVYPEGQAPAYPPVPPQGAYPQGQASACPPVPPPQGVYPQGQAPAYPPVPPPQGAYPQGQAQANPPPQGAYPPPPPRYPGYYAPPPYGAPIPPKKKPNKWLIPLIVSVVVVGIVSVIAAAVVGVLFLQRQISEIRTGEAYTIGDDSVVSLYDAVGERQMVGYERNYSSSTGANNITIQYQGADVEADAIAYALYLVDYDGFTLQGSRGGPGSEDEEDTQPYGYAADSGFIFLSRDSVEEGMIVSVEIYWEDNTLQIDLYQGENIFDYDLYDEGWYENLKIGLDAAG